MMPRSLPHEAPGAYTAEPALAAYQEVWQVIRRHKGRILFLMVLAVAAAAAFCAVAGPWYDSNAQLLVLKKRIDTTPITSPNQARAQDDYLATHMLLITSRRVIGQAIAKGGLEGLDQFGEKQGLVKEVSTLVSQALGKGDQPASPEERIATEILESLVVSRDPPKPGLSPSNEILNLSFRGRVAKDCPKILDAIIASYQEFLTETYRNTNEETLRLITDARVMVEKGLQAKEAAYQRFLAETPPMWRGQDRSTPHQDRLFKLDTRLLAVRTRRAELEASIGVLDRAMKEGRNPAPIVERMLAHATPTADGLVPVSIQDPARDQRPAASLEQELLNLHVQRAKLLAVRAPNHPEIVALSQQMASVRRLLLPSAPEAKGEAAADGRDIGTVKLALLKQEVDDLTISEQSLVRLFENEQKGASDSYSREIQDKAHRDGIERDRVLYENVLNRLKELSSVKDFGGYHTEVIGPALQGKLAIRKFALIFGLALFAGVLLGLAWAWLAEMGARRSMVSRAVMPAVNGTSNGHPASNGTALAAVTTNGTGSGTNGTAAGK
jgi:uncharacterized protein involved in exopolysaccharide biosynthesis